MRRKLIEVALPLEAINREAAREKSIRHGHPSTLHLWWARRPLAACRAVLFASLVDDPSDDGERARLFRLLEELVKWENSGSEAVLRLARDEIARSTGGKPPGILDPFCGGGSIPIEAQRLGLRALAGDLNPVAVLITKAMVEIPARFEARRLAQDIRRYGRQVRDGAERRIGHLYPRVAEGTVIAWIWARTVRSPNPAWDAPVPLVRTWELSARAGKERVWVEPEVDPAAKSIGYVVRRGGSGPGEGTVARGGGRCLATGVPIPLAHIKAEGVAGRLGQDLIAVVADTGRGRTYVTPDAAQRAAAMVERPADPPRGRLADHPQYMGTPRYGLDDVEDLFSDRQLLALTTFSDCLGGIRGDVRRDAVAAGMADDGVRLYQGGAGAAAYADAIATYLAFVFDKCVDYWSSVCSWHNSKEQMRNTFARQAIPMAWDFAEANPFSDSTGNWMSMVEWVGKAVERAPGPPAGEVLQMDAAARVAATGPVIVCTDPPYYDNVPYSDISDVFYVWLRRNLADVWPQELSTLVTPKQQELVADYQRHGSKDAARKFFESGIQEVFAAAADALPDEYPLTIFYAFKASETDEAGGHASTGWETFLQGVIDAGLAITATWPLRTELTNRPRAIGAGALATSVVLACRRRRIDAPIATRRDLLAALRREMPETLRALETGSIAPIDLPQAAIGPGMAVFSRYARVVEADGSPLRVRAALAMINDVLGEVLFNQEGDFDSVTRWAISWFEQYGMNPGPFGQADNLARAKATAVDAVVRAGVAARTGDRVRLLDRDELPPGWDPVADERLTVWEVAQHLIRVHADGGEEAAAALLRRVGGLGPSARELAYLLFGICERKNWAAEALAYNGLVAAWPEITRLGREQTLL